jgi:dTDP-4-dehydrorhamnose 3,5-epimerase
MQIKKKKLKGVFEITLEPREDNRGLFMRTYDENIFAAAGLNQQWVQENHSYSKKKGTLRGLHFQFPPHAEIKLIRAVRGEIFMVCVDIRRGSPTLGKWESLVLSESNLKAVYVPEGFALGMCALSDDCTLLYKMGAYYMPESQGVIKWNDPDIGIKWPADNPILSERDAAAMSFKEFMAKHKGLSV